MLILNMALTGCFKEEGAIAPFPRGEVSERSIAMTPTYDNQIYFSLNENRIVQEIPKTLWDISFSCSPNDATLRLNTGKNMYLAEVNATDLRSIKDTAGLKFRWDWSNGKSDSTALYGWEDRSSIYVINLGIDEKHNALGFVNVRFTLEGNEVVIEYLRHGDLNPRTARLAKNPEYNAAYFSFSTYKQVMAEPKKTEYDLVFRQYINYFAPEKLAYLVVGTLINPHQTRVARIFNKDFIAIDIADTQDYAFETRWDVIGYDWKEFKLSAGVYVVYANQNYLIQDSKGFFYKLHFTDFYSTSGERGYPKIEFERL